MRGPNPSKAATPRAAALTLIGVIFINMLGFGVLIPLLPFYAKSFDAVPWQIALIFSAYPIGSFFGEPFRGRLSDRHGRRPVLIRRMCDDRLRHLPLAAALRTRDAARDIQSAVM